jgi:hypothetical protein
MEWRGDPGNRPNVQVRVPRPRDDDDDDGGGGGGGGDWVASGRAALNQLKFAITTPLLTPRWVSCTSQMQTWP